MRTLFLILLSVPCWAGSPKYSYKDPKLDDEMRNIYYKLSVKPEFILAHSFTKSELQTFTPQRKGELYFCSDCTTDALCISTGTAIGAFSRVSARTTACQ